ncbi:MAG: HAD-IA family hydrolase [Candidatus Thorarchaeota archaeon]
MSDSMLKALVLDMDGVIRHLDVDAAERASQSIGFHFDELNEVIWNNEPAHELLCGRTSRDEWWAHVQSLDSRLVSISSNFIFDQVLGNSYIDHEVIEFVRSVSQNLVTGILSNCNDEGKVKIADNIGKDHPFDYILSSSDFGAKKPAPEVYHGMLETIDVRAEDCIFFDDRLANVEGARTVGIQAYLFEGIEQLRKLV